MCKNYKKIWSWFAWHTLRKGIIMFVMCDSCLDPWVLFFHVLTFATLSLGNGERKTIAKRLYTNFMIGSFEKWFPKQHVNSPRFPVWAFFQDGLHPRKPSFLQKLNKLRIFGENVSNKSCSIKISYKIV